MTSWKGRIKYVAKAIYRFMKTQTIKPDLFYLWLAEEEFPNKEKDLPEELILVCNALHIEIKWLKYNEYCHKRWHVYPKHFNDYVFSIDDDQYYDKNLIKNILNIYKSLNHNLKISFNLVNRCGKIYFNNSIKNQRYSKSIFGNVLSKDNHFCGQHAFMPGSFPLEAYNDENFSLCRIYCKKCDECWLRGFLIKNENYIYDIDMKTKPEWELQNNAVYKELLKPVFKNYYRKDLQLYIVLRLFPDNLNAFKIYFKQYNDDDLKNITIDNLIKILN